MKQQFYVFPAGHSAGRGADIGAKKQQGAFATIAQALAAARSYGAPQCEIVLMAGTHYVASAVQLGAADGGLVIKGEGEGKGAGKGAGAARDAVRVIGGVPLLQPSWAPVASMPGVWVCAAPTDLAVDRLFVNDIAQVQARFPNERDYGETSDTCNDYDTCDTCDTCDEATLKARVTRWKNPAGAHLRCLHEYGWGGNDYHVRGLDPSAPTGLALEWIGDNNRGSAYLPDRLIVENVLEELDAPREWYYDAANGKLYYYPTCNLDLEHAQFTLGVTSDLFAIVGDTAAHPVRDITLKNFSIAQTSRSMFSEKPYLPLLRGDWAVMESGAILLKNTERIAIENINFSDIGGNGVFFHGYHNACSVTHCDFSHIGSTAIQVVGLPEAAEQPSFWPHQHYPEHPVHQTTVKRPWVIGPVTEDYPRDVTLAENHIFDVGMFEKQSAGIHLSVSSCIRILHNTIHHSARSCININDGTFGGHEVAYNDIFDGQTQTMDHGPFNAWGRDRFWSVPQYHGGGEYGEVMRNYTATDGKVYDITQIDAYQTTELHHNRFHHASDAPHTWGVDLDDGSSNYSIHHNLCLGMGIKLREGFSRKVYNNIVVDGKMEIHVPYHGARDEVYANIYLSNAPWSYINVDLPRFLGTENNYHHNAYYDCGGDIALPQWHQDGTTDCGSLLDVAPQFRDPNANDYTIENNELLEAISFENFSMTAFGQTNCAVQAPVYAKTTPTQRSEQASREFWKGAFVTEVTHAIESATGSFGLDGIYMESVSEQSAAYAIGLRQRDIIKELNGVPLTDLNSFYNARAALSGAVPAIIHRTNEPVAVLLRF